MMQRCLCLVIIIILFQLELVDSAIRSPYKTFSSSSLQPVHSNHGESARLCCLHSILIPRGGGSNLTPSSSSSTGDNFGAKLQPIGKAFVELGVATWTFGKYLLDHQFKDPKKHIVEPLQQKINQALSPSETIIKKETAENSSSSSSSSLEEKVTTTSGQNGQSFLVGNRVIRLSFVAWLLSEALDLMGILHEDTPRLLKFQVDRVWYNAVQPRVLNAFDWFQAWWKDTMTLENLEIIPSKYNFALGTSVGMIAAPFLSAILGSIAAPAIVVYALAEGNALLHRRGRGGIVEFLDSLHIGMDSLHIGIGHALERILESFRKAVRSAMPKRQPIKGALILTSGGSHSWSVERLRLQPRYRRSYLFPWRKVPTNKAAIVIANHHQDGRGKPIHPMIAMIRHGFVVGSAIGFFLRT